VQRLQKQKLYDHQKPEEASGPAGDKQVLQYVPQAYGAQGSEVNLAPLAEFTLRADFWPEG
jgi:hypothetical protein